MVKKYSVLLIASGLILLFAVFFLVLDLNQNRGKGGLQITTNVKSKVFLNNQEIGSTPLCKCDQDNALKVGEYNLKLIPEDKNLLPFEYRAKIQKNSMTILDRTFLSGNYASAYVLYLEKIDTVDAQLLITSLPDNALVAVDGNSNGVTPLFLKTVSASEHEIEVKKAGYNKKTIKIKTVAGYKLIINVIMGTRVEPSQEVATPQAELKTEIGSPKLPQIKIIPTGTGFLRVRQGAGLSYQEIARIKPGEIYSIFDEKNNWLKIQLSDGTFGWISADFTTKIN